MNDKALAVEPENKEVAIAAEQQITSPMIMLSQALNNGQSIEVVEKLMALSERFEANLAKKAYTAAMAEFKRNAPEITKDIKVAYQNKDDSWTNYAHASLAQVASKCAVAMGPVGLSHAWSNDQRDGGMEVTCIITHEMGHSERVSIFSSLDTSGGKSPIQSIGSTLTYLQRYTLLAATGLAAHGQDNDALLAQQPKEVEFYPQERFDKNMKDAWQTKVENGEKSKEDLIAFISAKGVVTDEQRKTINDIEVQGEG